MSFILDALRKSENERRLEAAPDIMRGPLAVRRERMPVWAVFTLGMLSAALVALSAFVIFDRFGPGNSSVRETAGVPSAGSADTRADVAAPAAAMAAAPSPASATPAAQTGVAPTADSPAPAAQTAVVPTADSPEPVVHSPVADNSRAIEPGTTLATSGEPTAVLDAPAPPPQARAPLVAANPTTDFSGLPSYAAAVAGGLNLSALQMQLHVHSAAAANRFVVINGKRYGEGETLAEGPRIDAIAAEGAVLSFRGTQFLLMAN